LAGLLNTIAAHIPPPFCSVSLAQATQGLKGVSGNALVSSFCHAGMWLWGRNVLFSCLDKGLYLRYDSDQNNHYIGIFRMKGRNHEKVCSLFVADLQYAADPARPGL
jgi:hypothetical protein